LNALSHKIQPNAMDLSSLSKMRASLRSQLESPSTLSSAIFLAERLCACTNDPEDLFLLATAYAKKGSYAPALVALGQIHVQGPEARYLLAWCQFRLG